MPHCNDLQRIPEVLDKIGILVQDDIAKTGTNDQAQGQIEDQGLKHGALKSKLASSLLPAYQKTADEEAKSVHDPVPSNFDRAEFDQFWTNVWEWQQRKTSVVYRNSSVSNCVLSIYLKLSHPTNQANGEELGHE